MSEPKSKVVELPRKENARPAPRVFEMYGVMLGDPPGHLRAWREQGPAWSYGKTMKNQKPKRYRIVELD